MSYHLQNICSRQVILRCANGDRKVALNLLSRRISKGLEKLSCLKITSDDLIKLLFFESTKQEPHREFKLQAFHAGINQLNLKSTLKFNSPDGAQLVSCAKDFNVKIEINDP